MHAPSLVPLRSPSSSLYYFLPPSPPLTGYSSLDLSPFLCFLVFFLLVLATRDKFIIFSSIPVPSSHRLTFSSVIILESVHKPCQSPPVPTASTPCAFQVQDRTTRELFPFDLPLVLFPTLDFLIPRSIRLIPTLAFTTTVVSTLILVLYTTTPPTRLP